MAFVEFKVTSCYRCNYYLSNTVSKTVILCRVCNMHSRYILYTCESSKMKGNFLHVHVSARTVVHVGVS